jgi:hypothetical protein
MYVAIVTTLCCGHAFGDEPGAPNPLSQGSTVERQRDEHEIHQGKQLRWVGLGLGVLGIGVAVGSVPVWQYAVSNASCSRCAPQPTILAEMGALGMDTVALAAIASGVAAWVVGTQHIERARSRIVPWVVPAPGGALVGTFAVF